MKKIAILLYTLCLSFNAWSQNDKILHSFGYSFPYMDIVISPVSKYFDALSNFNYNTNKYDGQYRYCQLWSASMFTFIYQLRYNLYVKSDNLAFSLSAIPAIGLGVGSGFGIINLPLLLGLDIGAGSTYNTTSNYGCFLGVGLEYTKAPVFGLPSDKEFQLLISSWIQPVASVGYRYWNKNNKLREINFKYGFGFPETIDPLLPSRITASNSMSFRISWMKFLNY